MFNDNGNIKLWEDIKIEVHHKDNKKIYWFQIIYALTKSWKDTILKDKWNAKNNKLTSRKLYLILVDVNTVKPTAQDYFEDLFESSEFNWKKCSNS